MINKDEFSTTYLSSRMTRADLIRLVNIGLEVKSTRFARQACMAWLAIYQGDLEINWLHAKALIADQKIEAAIQILERVIAADPEYLEALELLIAINNLEAEKRAVAQAKAFSLGSSTLDEGDQPDWSKTILSVRKAIADGNLAAAEEGLHEVLASDDQNPLTAIYHLLLVNQANDGFTTLKLANIYRSRWPQCLHFALIAADTQMRLGDETNGLELLHSCAARDITGRVAKRLWGADHPYLPLWPGRLEIDLNVAVPVEIAAKLGWNQLPAGNSIPAVDPASEPAAVRPELPTGGVEEVVEAPAVQIAPVNMELVPADSSGLDASLTIANPEPAAAVPEPTPLGQAGPEPGVPAVEPKMKKGRDEVLVAIEAEFDAIAKRIRKPALSREDGRYPVYVVFSSYTGLVKQYGKQTAEVVRKEMQNLAELMRKRKRWGAMVFLPDDEVSARESGVEPITALDPWKLKLAIRDLDQALGKRGEMIGAVLIVGGPDVVPFHRLPNPTDDVDTDIPSDNPYATRDSNYFIPEWPVGRLTGESGPDSSLLLEQMRSVIRFHAQHVKRPTRAQNGFITQLMRSVRQWFNGGGRYKGSLGYTAAVWRKSSSAVFKPIGSGQPVWACPPKVSGKLDSAALMRSALGYYNLHGTIDSAEWYGQRDVLDPTVGPDYPVAVRPADLVKNGHAPRVVFSEACYGGHIEGKTEQESMALRFSALGVLVVVGSTTIAYGSVELPLIGADLLGYLFWKYLKDGFSAGEAFLQAKVEFVREMNKRQGFLDGEDQKSLISFVFYGDPMVSIEPTGKQLKIMGRTRKHTAVKTVCDRQEDGESLSQVSGEIIAQMKQVVSHYLPGLDSADVTVSHQHAVCSAKNHNCPTGTQERHSGRFALASENTVLTFKRQSKVAQHIHYSYARVTVDSKGKMVKLVVSR